MTKGEKVREGSSRGRRKRIVHTDGLTDAKLELCVDGFSGEKYIGKFQFGEVYRGHYDGKDVIVKIWKDQGRYKVLPGENHGRLADEKILHDYFAFYEFHPNVAKLLAFCEGGKYLAAIYHPDPKAIDTLHNLIEKDTFKWEHRMKVAFGFASLLRYMHTPHPKAPSDFPYLIRNIDAAHILVDKDHEALLFDFSMISGGMLTDKRDLLNQSIQGCCGYSDPIFAQPGKWSDKCDVFSYGVLLLSLISKRIYEVDGDCTNVPFVYEWAKNELEQQNSKSSLVHQSLELEQDFHFSDAEEITNIAMSCVEFNPQNRPTMEEVVKRMQKLHIVRNNANLWECCKMLDGVNEVVKTLHSSSLRRPGRLPFNHSEPGKDKGSGQSQTSGVNNVIKYFSYEDLRTYTGGFSKKNLICEFQLGKLFRGMVKRKKVIVKIWESDKDNYSSHISYNKDRLKDEICLLQHPELSSHANLVKMIGYCFEDDKLGVVYDLDPLDSLHNLSLKDEFTWLQRMKVINEFGKLLEFLHAPNQAYAPYRVGNVDAAHIILDKDYSPKLVDFGCMVGGIILSLREQRNLSLRGGYGYIDSQGGDYEEKDVFAFGTLLLCLISKRIPRGDDYPNNLFLAYEWARHEHEKWEAEGSPEPGFCLVHEDLRQEVGFHPEDGVALTMLGLDCVHYAYDRPSMEEVVEELQKLRVIREGRDIPKLANSNNPKFEGINCLGGTMLNIGCIDERKRKSSLAF